MGEELENGRVNLKFSVNYFFDNLKLHHLAFPIAFRASGGRVGFEVVREPSLRAWWCAWGVLGTANLLGYKYRYYTGLPIWEALDPIFGAAAVLLGF